LEKVFDHDQLKGENKMADKNIKKEEKKKKKKAEDISSAASTYQRPVVTQPELIKKTKKEK